MHLPDPVFPPLLTGHDVKGATRPFDQACGDAAAGKLGAGDVVWSRNTSRLEMAIILEPEVPLSRAVEMMPLAMVAVGDCLGALTPPQVGVMFRWPDTIVMNGGAAGIVRGAWGGSPDPTDIPDWIVICAELRHLRGPNDPEPGDTPDVTWISEEGGGELTRTDLIESSSRHFLSWLNTWQNDGFRSLHENWMFRAEGRDEQITVSFGEDELTGLFSGLDESGNLLIKGEDGAMRSVTLVSRFEHCGSSIPA